MAARGLAVLYGGAARARRALYRRGWLKGRRLPAPVVSVGNLTVGGTGKTPMVACLARELLQQGVKVAILSRGYGGRRKTVTCLSDGSRVFHKPPEVGEEAYWLARTLPGVIVYTGPGRYEAGLAAWQAHRPDVFLLDDGFQHFQLHRDLDIVLLDAEAPFGNGRLLPAGPLREPREVLNEAQVLILTRFKSPQFLLELKETYPDKTLMYANLAPVSVRRFTKSHAQGKESDPEDLRGKALFAFAGIARPQDFEETLDNLGVDLRGLEDYPDHHSYSEAELSQLADRAKESGAQALVTTSKDWARLGERWEGDLPLWVLEVEAGLVQSDILLDRIKKVMAGAQGITGETPAPPTLAPVNQQPLGLQPLPREVGQRFRELSRTGRPVSHPDRIKRILLRSPNWLGDAVMALPVLEGLKSFFPAAEITILAVGRVAPLFAGHPVVSEVLVYPRDRRKWPLMFGLRGRFDLALALPNSLESALSLFATGTPIRMGYATDGRRPLLTLAVKGQQHLRGLHEVYYFLGVLTGLGEVAALAPPALYVTASEVQEAREMLESAALAAGGPLVGLAPGAAYGPAKRWPPEHFAALAEVLHREREARLVLLGGPEDRAAALEVERQFAGPLLNLAGETTLRQALGVLSLLKVLVTNDSGLMHAAAALSVPQVAIFGSTDPDATRPFTDKATVIYHGLPCAPCLKRNCEIGYPCLTEITAAEVAAAARSWLE